MFKVYSLTLDIAFIFTFGIPIHDYQVGKPDEFSANVRYSENEMRAKIGKS